MKNLELEIGRILRRAMGLNPQAVRREDLRAAAATRMSAQAIRSPSAYLSLLRASRRERQLLVESVSLPHTGFFPQSAPFEALQRWVTNHWLARPSKKPLRLLGVPCATGEEPYSLAITLLELGIQPHQFHVDAADINDRALRHAAAAVYPDASLAATTEAVRERYFQREAQGHRLCPSVRSQVSFLKLDLLGSTPLGESYDIIYGRSLMIYFEPSAQERIIQRLERSLKPAGLLIVGPRERQRKRAKLIVPGWSEEIYQANLRKDNGRETLPVPRPSEAASPGSSRLKQATTLLEDRQLNEAAALCVQVLHEHRACAQAVWLLGRIAQLEGRYAEAREFFRRALYLQPRLKQAREGLLESEKLAKPQPARKHKSA
ncbi:MAG: hypothetical protein HYR88_04885 [Verrucomicrobia bacterium]|nr:hypothetical protein [Verrucomicrobiota bacterium]MBI3868880.1 hypothetical protein [Verrucomicrobiota bacterium]